LSADLEQLWLALPRAVCVAFEEQWAGLAAGGLPCGSSVIDAGGNIVGRGRNHVYDAAGGIETRARYALQHNRLAHAEMNALSSIATEVDPASLTLWTTQHPCSMCAAALTFIAVGKVCVVADDPSDFSSPEELEARHGKVPYQFLGDPLAWAISNVLFLYNSAVKTGESARNLRQNRDRYPELVSFTLLLAKTDALGEAARSGVPLPAALAAHCSELERVARHVPR
jgi:tRNA(Arg) A34 adenosine deaminase TadA